MIEICNSKKFHISDAEPAIKPAPAKPAPAKPAPSEPLPDSPRPPQPQRRPLTNPNPIPDRTCPTICPIRPGRDELAGLTLPKLKEI